MGYSRIRVIIDTANEWLRALFAAPVTDCTCGWTYHGHHHGARDAIERHRAHCPSWKDHDE